MALLHDRSNRSISPKISSRSSLGSRCQIKKKNAETNTEKYECPHCLQKDRLLSNLVVKRSNENFNLQEDYLAAINYINSCHSILNQVIRSSKTNSSEKLNMQLPDVPNFFNVFSSLTHLTVKQSSSKANTENDENNAGTRTDIIEVNVGDINRDNNKKVHRLVKRSSKEHSLVPKKSLIEMVPDIKQSREYRKFSTQPKHPIIKKMRNSASNSDTDGELQYIKNFSNHSHNIERAKKTSKLLPKHNENKNDKSKRKEKKTMTSCSSSNEDVKEIRKFSTLDKKFFNNSKNSRKNSEEKSRSKIDKKRHNKENEGRMAGDNNLNCDDDLSIEDLDKYASELLETNTHSSHSTPRAYLMEDMQSLHSTESLQKILSKGISNKTEESINRNENFENIQLKNNSCVMNKNQTHSILTNKPKSCQKSFDKTNLDRFPDSQCNLIDYLKNRELRCGSNYSLKNNEITDKDDNYKTTNSKKSQQTSRSNPFLPNQQVLSTKLLKNGSKDTSTQSFLPVLQLSQNLIKVSQSIIRHSSSIILSDREVLKDNGDTDYIPSDSDAEISKERVKVITKGKKANGDSDYNHNSGKNVSDSGYIKGVDDPKSSGKSNPFKLNPRSMHMLNNKIISDIGLYDKNGKVSADTVKLLEKEKNAKAKDVRNKTFRAPRSSDSNDSEEKNKRTSTTKTCMKKRSSKQLSSSDSNDGCGADIRKSKKTVKIVVSGSSSNSSDIKSDYEFEIDEDKTNNAGKNSFASKTSTRFASFLEQRLFNH